MAVSHPSLILSGDAAGDHPVAAAAAWGLPPPCPIELTGGVPAMSSSPSGIPANHYCCGIPAPSMCLYSAPTASTLSPFAITPAIFLPCWPIILEQYPPHHRLYSPPFCPVNLPNTRRRHPLLQSSFTAPPQPPADPPWPQPFYINPLMPFFAHHTYSHTPTMAEDEEISVEELTAQFELTELEQEELVLELDDVEEIDPGRSLIVKWATTATLDQQGMLRILNRLWRRKLRVIEHGNNVFHAILPSVVAYVSEAGPWIFNDTNILMAPFQPGGMVANTQFTALPIWVRVLDIPPYKITDKLALLVARKFFGGLIDFFKLQDGAIFDKFLRIRVRPFLAAPSLRQHHLPP